MHTFTKQPAILQPVSGQGEGYISALKSFTLEIQSEDLAETRLFENERAKQLYNALEKLKPEYQEVLYLIYFEEMSYQGAGKVMKKSESQITNLVHRGKQSLKKILKESGFEY